MSKEILYDRAFIKVGADYVPIVNQGSSNCYEYTIWGREIAEKNWYVLNNGHPEQFIFTADEIRELANDYETICMDNRGGICKSRNSPFKVGEFKRWIVAGMKSAYTVEEYSKFGNQVLITDLDGTLNVAVRTTQELKDALETNAGVKYLNVGFFNNREVKRPVRDYKRHSSTNFYSLEKYYVLEGMEGYLCRISSRRAWFSCFETAEVVKKFKTEVAASRYLEKHQDFLSRYKLSVKCILNERLP